jgi:dienelactone hydrolase
VSTEGTPLRPRSELALVAEKYKAYRVLLDVTEGVEVYGNLLIPREIQGRAPAVICQHGLNGTPEMITGLGQKDDTPYHEFGRRLAERGYVVFAPLILHYHPVQWTNDQVRQADAVGMMRVSMVIAQTERVLDFLQRLPCVDPQHIGYYGLSYGGYSAIWVSPLVDRLAAVVVSGHFNDWRSKITSDATPTSYLLHPDEDFYNWNVLHRFTHVELIMTTAPRPVCIEFGRRDGITTPEWTAYAWNQLKAVRDHVGLADRIQLDEFDGVHEVRGEESFQFVDRFLRPTKASAKTATK